MPEQSAEIRNIASTNIRQAVGYLRRSKKSDDGVVSLEVQEDSIRRYCELHSLVLPQMIRHDGVSGGKRERFTVIEAALRSVKADAVVVYNLDRLARDSEGLLAHLRQLEAHGTELHESTSGRIRFERADDMMVIQMRSAVAEHYRRLVSEKTRAAFLWKKSNGLKYSRVPPLGWCYENGRLVKDPEEQRAVALIKECRAAGLGRVRILNELRRAGYSGRGTLTSIERVMKGGARLTNRIK